MDLNNEPMEKDSMLANMIIPSIHEESASSTVSKADSFQVSEAQIQADGTEEDVENVDGVYKDASGADELKSELDKITIEVSENISPIQEEVFDADAFPTLYKERLPKEELVIQYADNFRRQYMQLYRDRKPLFLHPKNELGVEKFVSTTIRPTLLPFKELYTWDGCAEFVADYLNFKPLEIPYELPTRLFSPPTVIKRQLGNCFEYSTVLASLLIAAGYDAYVVSGYAQREVCLCDNTREMCSLLESKHEPVVIEEKIENPRYNVKPPKDLRSKFILKMEARQKAEEEERIAKQKKDEEQKLLELEKPPSDSLYGMRIRSWILVLAGKREVPESFFIEPFTGKSHFLTFEGYQGIESIWNHQNYWVNMQDCATGVLEMTYDLGDCSKWEYMLPGHDKPLLPIPDQHQEPDAFEDEEVEETIQNYLDMPVSWVPPIEISKSDFITRCPLGKKTWIYKKAKLEKFAPYLLPDGLVRRLTTYSDRDLTDQLTSKEFYKNRVDRMITRHHDLKTGIITECFLAGRPLSLKEHIYKASAPGIENDRTMEFYSNARVDGLYKRIESPTTITEHYKDREDFLYYVFVTFHKQTVRLHPQDGKREPRNIQRMVQKFYRNRDKAANSDIAEVDFSCSDDKIHVTYHLEDDRITASTREFIKPTNWDEKGATLNLTQDMLISYEVDPHAKPIKMVDHFLKFCDLLKAEHKCMQSVRESEDEVREILDSLNEENDSPELTITVYDTERNEKAKQHRIQLDKAMEEMKLRKQDMELDYLAPFLAQLGHPDKLTRVQAYKLKEDCLNDLKQRLIDRANLIQARFEKETQELQKKQLWYQQNQMSMKKEDEEDYLNYCSGAMFRIHILELRLNRHKEMAPHKYKAMEKKLRFDPRLMEFF